MKGIVAGALALLCFLFPPPKVKAQALFEYGKQLQSLPSRQPSPGRGAVIRKTPKVYTPRVYEENSPEGVVPPLSSPSRLLIKGSEVNLHASQQAHSEVVSKLQQGEQLELLAQVLGEEGRAWYLVKTSQGAVGWVKSSDVEELAMPIKRGRR